MLSSLHKVKAMIASRGVGKTYVIGYDTQIKMMNLPGSHGLLTTKTIKQLKGKGLAEIESVWRECKMKKDYHYKMWGKKPDYYPDNYKEIHSDDVIWFCDGSMIEIVASNQFDAARGGSYDYVEGDEMGHFPEEFFDEILIPSVRGNVGRYLIKVEEFCLLNGIHIDTLEAHLDRKIEPHYTIKNPHHGMICLYGSPPKLQRAGNKSERRKTGVWIYRFEKLAQQDPRTFFWLNASVYDAKHTYGEDNIETAKKLMPKKSFDIELGGMKIEEAEMRFYLKFSKENNGFKPERKHSTTHKGVLYHTYLNRSSHINITLDFSGYFNCMLIIQPLFETRRERVYDYMWLKQHSIDDLVDAFCEKYQDHQYKYVLVYGEPRGHDKNPISSKTIYDMIWIRFKHHGWDCEIKAPRFKKTEDHIVRYETMNKIFEKSESHYPVIEINENLESLIKAINLTERLPDFTKNKSTEKDRDYPQEEAPHPTDALDYYTFQRYSHIFSSSY